AFMLLCSFFFLLFLHSHPTLIYTLSLHDALPIFPSNFKCDFRFERVANHFSLACLFKFLTDDTAQSDGFGHLIMRVWVAPASKIAWKFLDMNRISCTEEFPRFFSCEGKNWCNPS